MASRTIAIGDIHGCHVALEALLERISPQSDDVIVTLGDYVDRGPGSAAVVDCLMGLRQRCQLKTLLGNHEIMLIAALKDQDAFEFWLHCGGRATLKSYGGWKADIPESHIDFFQACLRYYEDEQTIFLHANYSADLALDMQPDLTLFWEHLYDHFPARHISGKNAVVGHTPQQSGEPLVLDHLMCIDTYCYGQGFLTAVDVATRQFWQVDQEGAFRESAEPSK